MEQSTIEQDFSVKKVHFFVQEQNQKQERERKEKKKKSLGLDERPPAFYIHIWHYA